MGTSIQLCQCTQYVHCTLCKKARYKSICIILVKKREKERKIIHGLYIVHRLHAFLCLVHRSLEIPFFSFFFLPHHGFYLLSTSLLSLIERYLCTMCLEFEKLDTQRFYVAIVQHVQIDVVSYVKPKIKRMKKSFLFRLLSSFIHAFVA